MKVVLLAGGFGTRISEESELKPKPMIEIGSKPILWHIMKHYAQYGYNEFIILCGYKGYVIKEYFANYFLHQSDVTIDLATNSIEAHRTGGEKWKVTLLNTGLDTMTGGRIKRAQSYLQNERFLLSYGDGVSDVNLDNALKSHEASGKLMTVTAVQPEGRFGSLNINDSGKVESFLEKPKGDGSWINGGFFICEPEVLNYIEEGDKSIFERTPMERLSKDGELNSYKHTGFWKPMDTLRDKKQLNELYYKGMAPWVSWD